MSQRLNFFQQSPALAKKFTELSMLMRETTLEAGLLDFVNIRASQLNGCAFCLDMHVKEAKIHGERDLRVHHVAIWRESQLFSPRERAAFAWTEALTQLSSHGVSDALYAEALEHFTEAELSDLTFQIVIINGWNRANIAFPKVPGSLDKAYGLDKAGLA